MMSATKLGAAVRWATAAVVAAGLAACGSESGTPARAGGPATISITSYPAARAFVDGVDRGTTPISALSVTAGTHRIVLAAEGFAEHAEDVDVKAGEKRAVDGVLVVKNPDDPAAHTLLAQATEVVLEPAEAVSTHRGAGPDIVVMFPAGEVRKAGLSTFRVEIDPKFEQTGNLEFRDGKKVLWSQAFAPDNTVTVGAVPKEVLDAVKAGDVVTWGFFPTDRKQKAVTSTFKVIEKKQADQKLARIDADVRLAKQPVFVRDLLKADTLQNYSLFTEALTRYLDILAKNPDTGLPHKGIANCLQRLKLTESRLYGEALAKKPPEKSPMQPARIDAGGGIGEAGTPGVEPTKPGPTPVPAMAEPAMGDAPAPATAMGEEPGPDATPAPGAVPSDRDYQARALAMASAELRMRADEAALRADAAKDAAREAEKAAGDAQSALQALQADAEAAKQAYESAADGSPEKAAAEAKLRETMEKVHAAEEAARAAQQAVGEAQKTADRAEAEARKRAQQAEEAAKAAGAAGAPGTGPVPATDAQPALPPAGDADRVREMARSAADSAKRAQEALDALHGKVADATGLFQQADQAKAEAEALAEKAAATNDPADVAAADAAMKKAAELDQKAQDARTALGDQSLADRLKQAVEAANFAQRAAALAARVAAQNPGDPRALRAAREAAQKAEDAANRVQQILAGIPTGG